MSRDALPRGKRDVTQAAPLAPSRTPGWSGREFTSPLGVPILVGRNRKENEELSLRIARDPDVWMHVRGTPGAHVVLQMSRIKAQGPPQDECLQMAADLAAFYSEMRDENKALVSIANPRHVTKPNGAVSAQLQACCSRAFWTVRSCWTKNARNVGGVWALALRTHTFTSLLCFGGPLFRLL